MGKDAFRFGMDQDPRIHVELTEEERAYCIRISFAEGVVTLHTRSAIDLQHKLGIALMDWIGAAALRNIEGFEAPTDSGPPAFLLDWLDLWEGWREVQSGRSGLEAGKGWTVRRAQYSEDHPSIVLTVDFEPTE